ncbi:MAG TPA: HAMP domain-containing sensor histidine kinase [Mycobacteriales bacterium]|jgi:signal transduction histidine kinase
MDPAEQERRREVNDALRHDTRNWLGIGKGYASMLTQHFDRLTAEQRDRALAGLVRAFDRLDAFTRGVLIDEQLETRTVVAQRGEVTVETLLRPVREAYPDVAVEAEDATVLVDPVMVREILDQLVRNAVTAGEPPVSLRVTADGGTLRIEVHDSGETIGDDEVLFERYATTEHTRRLHKSGMGFGLAIVRRYAEAHGGRAGVRRPSPEAPGTTFWVELPPG